MIAATSRKPPARDGAVLSALYAGPGHAWALLDAARSRRVLRLVKQLGDRASILYEGPVAPEIAEVAPYLVPADRGSGVAEQVVSSGWGDAWGVFCKTELGGDELRRHLRRFLTVRTEAGKKMLFRFYDPRVLRVYLPTCTPAELQAFFGPVDRFLCEGEGARSVFVHRRAGEAYCQETISLPESPC